MVLDKMKSVLHPVSPTEYSCKTWTEYIGQFSEDYEKSILARILGKKTKIGSTTEPLVSLLIFPPIYLAA